MSMCSSVMEKDLECNVRKLQKGVWPDFLIFLSWVYIWTSMRTTHVKARQGKIYGTIVHCLAFAEASNRPYINVLNANSLWSTDSRRIDFDCLLNVHRTAEYCLPHFSNTSALNDHFDFACHVRFCSLSDVNAALRLVFKLYRNKKNAFKDQNKHFCSYLKIN